MTVTYENGWASSGALGGGAIEKMGKLVIVSFNASAAAASANAAIDLGAAGVAPRAGGTVRGAVWHDPNTSHTGTINIYLGVLTITGWVAADTAICGQISYFTA